MNKFDCTGSSGGSTTAPPSLNTTGGMELPQVGEPYVMFDEETECKIGIAMAVCFLSGLVQVDIYFRLIYFRCICFRFIYSLLPDRCTNRSIERKDSFSQYYAVSY